LGYFRRTKGERASSASDTGAGLDKCRSASFSDTADAGFSGSGGGFSAISVAGSITVSFPEFSGDDASTIGFGHLVERAPH